MPELPKKSPSEVASSEQVEKGETPESVNVKTKIPTPTHNTRQIENVTELTMKSAEADVIRESVERAKAFERKNHKADAIRAYEKALFLLGEPMNNLASLYLDVGKNDQAVLLAHLAVIISPDQAGFQQ